MIRQVIPTVYCCAARNAPTARHCVTNGRQIKKRASTNMAVGIARPSCTSAVRGSWSGILSLCLVVFLVASVALAQGPVRKNVLMINVIGQSHPGPVIVTNLDPFGAALRPAVPGRVLLGEPGCHLSPRRVAGTARFRRPAVSPPQTGSDCAAGAARDADPGRAEDDIPQCPGGLLLHRSRSDRPDESRLPINGLVVSIGAREDGGGCAGSATGNPPPLRGRGADPIMTDASPRW